MPDGSEDNWDDTPEDLIQAALGIISNVDMGMWGNSGQQSPEWVEAADRWLARHLRVLNSSEKVV